MLDQRDKRSNRLARFKSRLRKQTEEDRPPYALSNVQSKDSAGDSLASDAEQGRFQRIDARPLDMTSVRPASDADVGSSSQTTALPGIATATTRSRQTRVELRREPTASDRFGSQQTHRGLGGFPMPSDVLASLVRRVALILPQTIRDYAVSSTEASSNLKLDRRFTTAPVEIAPEGKSRFRHLTQQQKDELGGVEYRASALLLKIVIGVSSTASFAVDRVAATTY